MFTSLTLFLKHFDEFWYSSLLMTAVVWKTCVWCCVVSSGAGCKYRWKGYFFPFDEKPVRINRTVNKSVLWTDYSLIRDLWSSVYNLQPLNFQGVLVVSKCEAHCETWLLATRLPVASTYHQQLTQIDWKFLSSSTWF